MAVVTSLHNVSDEVRQLRVDLAASFRLIAKLGMTEGIDSHLTVKVPSAEERFLINPSSRHWAEMRASDLLLVDGEGGLIEGNDKPPRSGVHLHLPIHKKHPRGTCVFHTHSSWAAALSCIKGGRLEMCHQNSARFYKDVAYDEAYDGWAVSFQTGENAIRAMGDKSVLFLSNHGPLVVAETIADAFDQLYYLERACDVQLRAMSTGRPLSILSDKMLETVWEQSRRYPSVGPKHFAAMKRLLDEEGSSYAS